MPPEVKPPSPQFKEIRFIEDNESLISVRDLVQSHNTSWSGINQRFETNCVCEKRFLRLLERCANKLKKDIDYQTHFGFIEKKDIPNGSKVFVRADLHGDLKSLIENLYALQEQNLVDENFKCKEHVHLVFLGDYVDRGDHSLEVLELLAMLKLENPDCVTLIRGNHESISTNNNYNFEPRFKKFLGSHSSALEAFYNTMPLATYIAVEGEKREYILFTHGMFELHIDPLPLLNSECELLPISRTEHSFSSRVKTIIDAPLESRLQELYFHGDETALQILSSLVPTPITRKVVGLFKNYISPPENFEMRLSARRISILKKEEAYYDQRTEKETAYSWGDVQEHSSMSDPGRRTWHLSPPDIDHALNLMGNGTTIKVEFVFRGHQHDLSHGRLRNEKVVVTTLPIGPHAINSQKLDRTYLLTSAPTVDKWEKMCYRRNPFDSATTFTDVYPLRSLKS